MKNIVLTFEAKSGTWRSCFTHPCQSDGQIDHRNIRSGNTECHTSELTIKLRDDLSNCLGSSSGCRNDVLKDIWLSGWSHISLIIWRVSYLGSSSSITPCLSRWPIDRFLGCNDFHYFTFALLHHFYWRLTCSCCVNGSHQPLENPEVIMDDLGKRRKAICGAETDLIRKKLFIWEEVSRISPWSVWDDFHARIVTLVVNTHDEHGCIGGWGRDDDLLGSTLTFEYDKWGYSMTIDNS